MNICMFTNTYLPQVGGVARSVALFAEDLSRLGHRLLVIAPKYAEATKDEENASVEVLRVPAIQRFNGSDFSVRIALPFIIDQKIEEFQPHIIHSHHPFLLGDAALREARTRAVPLVFTHHTLYEEYTHYVPLDSEPLKRFIVRFSTAYGNFCSKVVAPSASIAKLIRQRGVQAPIAEIPSGVDEPFFDPGDPEGFRKRYSIPRDIPLIGHVGRLAPEKNLTYLARAVASYLQRDPNTFLIVVGEGPSRKDIREIFREAGIENRILLPGKMSGTELRDAYRAMDVFVFASKSETQGMVLAEAMAARTPVIALNASGTREVARDRKNGRLLSENATEEAFGEAIAQGIEEQGTLEAWRLEAAKSAKAFTRRACAGKLEEAYEQALSFYKRAPSSPDWGLVQWDRLLSRIRVEWDLVSKKISAAVDAVRGEG